MMGPVNSVLIREVRCPDCPEYSISGSPHLGVPLYCHKCTEESVIHTHTPALHPQQKLNHGIFAHILCTSLSTFKTATYTHICSPLIGETCNTHKPAMHGKEHGFGLSILWSKLFNLIPKSAAL